MHELLVNFQSIISRRKHSFAYNGIWQRLHLDGPLLLGISIMLIIGLCLLYSASNANYAKLNQQLIRIFIGYICLFAIAQVNTNTLKKLTTTIFVIGLTTLIIVNVVGYIGKGAKRWLDLGVIKFQPAEIMKYAVPMLIALILHREQKLGAKKLGLAIMITIVPCYLIFLQPDLGTAIMVCFSGIAAILFAGISFKYIMYAGIAAIGTIPIIWQNLHTYQKNRVLTFLYPDSDPLGHGYHIIQSKIAIGSGGLYGKGWLQGTQAHLDFLPESTTDFIFALGGEEFGLLGCAIIIALYGLITHRALVLSQRSHDNYAVILGSSLSLTFFVYSVVNIGMVSGIFPVVGIPLPLISYGGTSMITTMLAFGIIMSLTAQRKLANT